MTDAVIIFLVHVVMALYFVRTRPREPNPSSGRVYSLQEHYEVVYLTWPEYLVAGPIPFWIVAVLALSAFYSRQHRRPDRDA